jgi:hypothetical protein
MSCNEPGSGNIEDGHVENMGSMGVPHKVGASCAADGCVSTWHQYREKLKNTYFPEESNDGTPHPEYNHTRAS